MSSIGWKIFKIGESGRVVTGKTPSTQDLKNFGSSGDTSRNSFLPLILLKN